MNGLDNDDFTRPSHRDPFNPRPSISGVSYIDGNGQIIGELPQGYIVGQQFRVRNTLGEGGMSYVYLCDDISLNRQVALKVMRVSAQSNEQALTRFKREGQAVAMLSHQNVVKVHSLQFTERDQPFLVMEVVQGVSLSELLEISGPFKLPRALKFLGQICDGISHAHANGVIHRDLKLSNIMLINPDRSDEKIKILDFGIAKVVTETSVKMTQTGEVFGSPAYMSPEQALGKSVDTKTDQYSLGCIAFELLTGRTPFAAENYLAVLMSHVQEEAPSVNDFMQTPVPDNIERTIARLLAKEPQDRFASIDEVKKAFSGEIKVSRPISVRLDRRVSLRYLTFVGAFLLCLGAIAAATLALQPPKVKKVGTFEKELGPKDNFFDIALDTADDGFLNAHVLNDKYRSSYDDIFNGKNISDKSLATFANCPNLRVLSLQNCKKLTAHGIGTLAKLPLLSLKLNRTKTDDKTLASLATMQQLQSLSVDGCEAITEAGIAHLALLPKLNYLSINDLTHLSGNVLKSVAKIKSLTELHIDSNEQMSSGLQYLANSQLTTLSMQGCLPKTDELHALTRLHSLEKLILDDDEIDEKVLPDLAKLPHLKQLSVKKSKISQSMIDKFRSINPRCELILK
jgi:serine/threonine protein kinase